MICRTAHVPTPLFAGAGAALRGVVIAAAMLLCQAAAAPAIAQETAPLVPFEFADNPGDLDAWLYLPPDLPAGRPLVVALHGCLQGPADIDDETGWRRLADEFGFALLLPGQRAANNPLRCFNWMLPGDRDRGAGEAESIRRMVTAAVAQHGLDAGKVYAAGHSAGGAMVAVLLAAYPDAFAGGAILAGVPYLCVSLDWAWIIPWAAKTCLDYGNIWVSGPVDWGDRVRGAVAGLKEPFDWPVVSIWYGVDDDVVNPVNARDLVAQWTNVHGLDQKAEGGKREGNAGRIMHRKGRRVLVEEWRVEGLGHAVPVDPTSGCGIAGDYAADAGLCSARRIADFWGLTK